MERYTIESNKKKSRIPARLDFLQSGTGLVLGLFVWAHIVLDASIILGPGAFNWVSQTMGLAFLSGTGQGYPIAVFFAVFVVFTLFIIHALLGMRKIPNSWKQHCIMKDQMAVMKHQDTNLWYIQVLTGFIMLFAGSVHLYTMLTHPGSIDPYLCAGRVVSGNMWFVYLILLVCAVVHGNIGLYRLCMKWGWFQGDDSQRGREIREKLKNLRNKLTIVLLCVGFLVLLLFVIIGLRYKNAEPGQPIYADQPHTAEPAPVKKTVEEAPEAGAVNEQNEQAALHIEETVTHDNTPAVQEPEPAHEEAADDQGAIQEQAAGDDEAAHETAAPEAGAADEQKEPAATHIEETLTHDNTPAVQEPEPAHEEAADGQGAIQEQATGDDQTAHETAAPEAGAVDEQKEPAAAHIEETVTHDNAPAVQEPEPAHEEAADGQGAIQGQAAGDDEATGGEAGPLDSEKHVPQGEAPHIEGGYGPQETL